MNQGQKGKKLNKDILNIIRTTMRNNIELTNIADKKASTLLSLNALMITFMVPFIIPYSDFINQYHLGIPLTILVFTCFVTIYVSARVLKPGRFFENTNRIAEGKRVSPFFFGNYYKMSRADFQDYFSDTLENPEDIMEHITEDLHSIGARLGRKMYQVRIAFDIFTVGFFLAISTTVVFLFIF